MRLKPDISGWSLEEGEPVIDIIMSVPESLAPAVLEAWERVWREVSREGTDHPPAAGRRRGRR